MKHGMIFLAALVAVALVFTPTAFAAQDTKVVNSSVASTAGPGPDIALGSDGSLYASFGEGNNVQVYKGSSGSALSTQRGVANAGDTVRLTAIGLTTGSLGKDTPVVAAFVGGETEIFLFMSTTSSNLTQVATVDPIRGASTLESDTYVSVSGLDLAVNDSFIVVVTSLASDNTPDNRTAVTRVAAYKYDTAVNAPVLSHSILLDTGTAVHLQVVFDPVEKNTSGTNVIWVVRTQLGGDTAQALGTTDSAGVTVQKVYLTGGGAFVQVDTLARGLGDSRTIGRIVAEDVSGSDTRARISLSVTSLDSALSGKIRILEFGDSRTTAPNAVAFANFGRLTSGIGAADSYVVSLDTSTVSNDAQRAIRSQTFGRSGSSVGWVLALAPNDNSLGANADTIIAVSQSTPGGSSFTSDTAITGAGNRGRIVQNLSGAMVGSSLYSIGWDDGSSNVFYITQSFGDSGKKKDSGVCLFDRLFGRTSLKAVSPSLKTFRDTLLGTDLGRKIVSLYYTF